ncbi:MAG: hypothetical protein KDD94_14195, partial [Calditrichaeota bacterium]|nr:hypothetical protein [Calditrichota bacterium]
PDDNSLLILQMTGDHTHNRINVPKDLVDDGKGGSFKLTGGNHGHTFLLKDFEMQSIKNGQQVFVSTIGSDHIHTFYLQKKPETLGPKLT